MGFRFLYPLFDRAGLTFLLRDDFITADAAPLQDSTADSGTVTTGTVNGGTYASTAADDGTNWEINEVAGTPGFLLTMDFSAPVAGQAATQLVISGNYDGNAGHTVDVDAYDWVADTYDTLGQLPDSAVEDVYTFALESSHTDTDGTIRIRINHSSAGNVTHVLYLDWVYVQDFVRPCEPGPGTLTVTDTNDQLSISGGELNYGGGNTEVFIYGDGQTRAAGLMYSAEFQKSALGYRPFITWNVNTDTSTTEGNRAHSIICNNDAEPFSIGTDTPNAPNLTNLAGLADYLAADTDVRLLIVLRSTGAFYFIDDYLIWISNTDSTSPLYPTLNVKGTYTAKIDNMRVAQLPAPFDTDDGLATDSIASPSASDTFTHEADFILEFTVDTLPFASSIEVLFRIQDSNNHWAVHCDAAGKLKLVETVGGAGTNRINVTVLSGGERIVVVADDDDIALFYDDTQAGTYAVATNFKTETNGELETVGTGGVISALKTWPRTLSGTAKAKLDEYSA